MFKVLNCSAVVFTATLLACTAARANLLLNGSFEDSAVDSGDVCGPYSFCRAFTPGDTIDGWVVIGKGGVAGTAMVISRDYVEPDNGDGQVLHFDPADGNQSIDLTGEGNQGTTNGIKQTVATIPGQMYQLTFAVGHQYDQAPGYAGPASVSLWLDLTGGGSTEVGLYSNDADTPDDVSWESFTYDFEAIGDATTVAFLNATPIGNNFAGLDAVSMVALLPEAPSGWILGAGILMLWPKLAGRRRAS